MYSTFSENLTFPTPQMAMTNPIHDRSTEPTLALPSLTRPQPLAHNSGTPVEKAETGALFQAIGVVVGEVKSIADGKMTITIDRYEYPLFYKSKRQRAFAALVKEIESTDNATQRLVVYPKVIHFPKREQSNLIAFQLVGFDRGREENTVSSELQDLEFKLSGLWQFIPVCSTPCISVFRNFTPERLEFIKQAEPAQKVKFMKGSHVPVLWKDAQVKPFRFNPKADYDQGHPAFVSLKAKFLPHRSVFGFVELLAPPQEKAPKFLKASKEDKALVQQEVKKNKPKSQIPKTSGNTNKTLPFGEEKSGLPNPTKTLKEKPRLKKTGN